MTTITPDETLLGLLAAKPRHGYELLECFRDANQLGQVWNLSTSQLYAVLKRLERDKLTEGREIQVPDAPPRVEYILTEAGRERLERWLDNPHPSGSVRRVRVEFLSRLFIARSLNMPTVSIVTRQRQACQHKRAELITQREQALPGVGLLSLELAIAQMDAILRWIDRCEITPLKE